MNQTLKEKEHKTKIVEKHRVSPNDTGSSEVQVALVTDRINELTQHLRTHKKDYSTQRGLLKLVGRRRRLLDYLKVESATRYLKLINSLDLRK